MCRYKVPKSLVSVKNIYIILWTIGVCVLVRQPVKWVSFRVYNAQYLKSEKKIANAYLFRSL